MAQHKTPNVRSGLRAQAHRLLLQGGGQVNHAMSTQSQLLKQKVGELRQRINTLNSEIADTKTALKNLQSMCPHEIVRRERDAMHDCWDECEVCGAISSHLEQVKAVVK